LSKTPLLSLSTNELGQNLFLFLSLWIKDSLHYWDWPCSSSITAKFFSLHTQTTSWTLLGFGVYSFILRAAKYTLATTSFFNYVLQDYEIGYHVSSWRT